jgi:uncharacterized protein YfeS
MLAEDSKFVRSSITSLFFRGLGEGSTPREAYLAMRNIIGTATTTPEGVLLTHILKGFELALDCQVQIFLIFDKQTYMGFVLLGEEFHVYFNGWHDPKSEEDLRADLETLFTHEQSRVALASVLSRCKVKGTDMIEDVPLESIEDCSDICDMLARIDVEGTPKADIERITMLLKNLNFPKPYRKINKDNIVWAIDKLGSRLNDFSDERIFIHPTEWSGIDSDVYKTLGAFGPQSISFIDPRGEDYLIPITDGDLGYYKDAIGAKKRLPVYEKNLKTCVSDWEQMKVTGKIKLKLKERAIGSRAFVLTGENIAPVWNALISTAKTFKQTSGKGKASEKQGPKAKVQKMGEPKDFDSLF